MHNPLKVVALACAFGAVTWVAGGLATVGDAVGPLGRRTADAAVDGYRATTAPTRGEVWAAEGVASFDGPDAASAPATTAGGAPASRRVTAASGRDSVPSGAVPAVPDLVLLGAPAPVPPGILGADSPVTPQSVPVTTWPQPATTTRPQPATTTTPPRVTTTTTTRPRVTTTTTTRPRVTTTTTTRPRVPTTTTTRPAWYGAGLDRATVPR